MFEVPFSVRRPLARLTWSSRRSSPSESLPVRSTGPSDCRPSFSHPAERTTLVEITPASATTPATITALRELAERMGKRAIVLRHDVPGFVWNRLQAAILRESLALLENGVCDAHDIDAAVSQGLAPRWVAAGPLATLISAAWRRSAACATSSSRSLLQTCRRRQRSALARMLEQRSTPGYRRTGRGWRQRVLRRWRSHGPCMRGLRCSENQTHRLRSVPTAKAEVDSRLDEESRIQRFASASRHQAHESPVQHGSHLSFSSGLRIHA